MRKRGQVSIFVIIAVLLIASILLFFYLRGRGGDLFYTGIPNPQDMVEKCVKDAVEDAVDIMLSQGGYLNPEHYKLYGDMKVAYLCYNRNYYQRCIMQEPNYIKHLEDEVFIYIEPKIKDCFYLIEKEYKRKNYVIETSGMSFSVGLKPKIVYVVIDKKFEISKNKESVKFEKFKINVASPLYELGTIAMEIATQESKYGHFEYVGYMLLYKDFDIEKKAVGSGKDSCKIYIIGDKRSGKKLNIAIRSVEIPAGI